MYAGAFGYADDVAPSLDALIEMVSICKPWAAEHQLLVNPSNSKLLYFNISHENLSVKLCGKEDWCFWCDMKLISVILSVVVYLTGQSLNLYVRLIKGVTT